MSRSSPDKEDEEAWLEKERCFVYLEDSHMGFLGSCPLPHVLFCGPAFPGAGLPPSLREDTQPNLMLAHHCRDARKSLL